MLGGMLAGHEESGGEVIVKNGKKYKLFYGMSSDTAMKKHAGGVAEYRSERLVACRPEVQNEPSQTELDPLNLTVPKCKFLCFCILTF